MIKKGYKVINKKGLNYIQFKGDTIKYTPWLGNLFAPFYDSIMSRSIFTKKFAASEKEHNKVLFNQFSNIHNKKILEIACGSGNISSFLPTDNIYYGLDISKGLLKLARKRFAKAGFNEINLFLSSAEILPFNDHTFDICICNLSLNFFANPDLFFEDISDILKKDGYFFCSIPIPERMPAGSKIRGKLYTENDFRNKLNSAWLTMESLPFMNGAILYFIAKPERG